MSDGLNEFLEDGQREIGEGLRERGPRQRDAAGARPAPGGEAAALGRMFAEWWNLAKDYGPTMREIEPGSAMALAAEALTASVGSALPGAAASGREDEALAVRLYDAEMAFREGFATSDGPELESDAWMQSDTRESILRAAEIARGREFTSEEVAALRARSAPRPGGQAAGDEVLAKWDDSGEAECFRLIRNVVGEPPCNAKHAADYATSIFRHWLVSGSCERCRGVPLPVGTVCLDCGNEGGPLRTDAEPGATSRPPAFGEAMRDMRWIGDELARAGAGASEPTEQQETQTNGAQSMRTLKDELAGLLNAHCQENHSDTPDFVLAQYLMDCLSAWNRAVGERERWYSRPVEKDAPIHVPASPS